MNNEKIEQIASTMSARKIGIELEILIPSPTFRDTITALSQVVEFREESYNHVTKTWWKCVPDHSLSASNAWRVCEIVSPPLLPNELFKQTALICEVLKNHGVKVNRSCGFHVHHDAAKLTIKRLQYAVNLIVKSEQAIDCIMAKSRRGDSRWCRSNKEVLNTCINHELQIIREGGHYRYRRLNLTSFLRHGTLEYRQHAGTIELEKIVLWVAFTQALTMRSRLKVTQNADYQNPMHNVLIQIKWATCNRDGALIPVSEIHADLCKRVVDRMTHFGFAEEAPRLAPHVAEA